MRVAMPSVVSASTSTTWRPLRAVMAARLAATWPLVVSEPVPTTTSERAGRSRSRKAILATMSR